MKETTIAAFPGNFRVHMGIPVANLERSIAFYQLLFQERPTKQKPGYAKFEPQDPSVNFTLNQSDSEQRNTLPGQHFGIQVKSVEAVSNTAERFRQAGLNVETHENQTCCYAVQDKLWVQDPDGNHWEIFCVLQNADSRNGADTECCSHLNETHTEEKKLNCC